MKHLKKYWIMYTLLVVAIVAIIYFNWETIKGWFSSETESQRLASGASERKECINNGGGNCIFWGLSVPCSECTKRGITIVS